MMIRRCLIQAARGQFCVKENQLGEFQDDKLIASHELESAMKTFTISHARFNVLWSDLKVISKYEVDNGRPYLSAIVVNWYLKEILQSALDHMTKLGLIANEYPEREKDKSIQQKRVIEFWNDPASKEFEVIDNQELDKKGKK